MKGQIIKIFSIFCLIWMSSQEIMGADGLYRPNILFIHHSVGENLIRDGSIREILTEEGFDFWDHGYNNSKFGLRNEKGNPAGCYWIPEDNTNPDGLAALFSLEPDSDNV